MPDFGIMRGFNEKLFGDKLYAGQLPTQLGLIGSSDFGTDPDAQAFFDRVDAATGTLSLTEKQAVNQLVVDMKAAGIWSAMKAIYPMVGASAAACAQNLKSASFTGAFSSGWTFASTGVTGNGTSAYMDTGLVPNGNLSQNDTHAGIYSRTNSKTRDEIEMGVGSANFYFSTYYAGGPGAISNIHTTGFGGGASQANSLGLFLSQRTTSTNTNIYQNNTLIRTNTQASVTPSSSNIILGGNSAGEYSIKELAFISVGASFDATQRGNFYTAVQAFQTTLSRNV
jgi:hypothetical protein